MEQKVMLHRTTFHSLNIHFIFSFSLICSNIRNNEDCICSQHKTKRTCPFTCNTFSSQLICIIDVYLDETYAYVSMYSLLQNKNLNVCYLSGKVSSVPLRAFDFCVSFFLGNVFRFKKF